MPFIGSKVALKISSGEFLADSNDKLQFASYDTKADNPEIMFYVPSALNDVFIQTYTREFASVNANSEIVKVPCNYNLGKMQAFSFICLGMNFVAIKAGNGKYVRFDNKSKTLLATSDTIGKDETFEVIPVFR